MSGRVISSQYDKSAVAGRLMVNDYPSTTILFQQSFNVPSDITKITSISVYGERTSSATSGNVTVTLNGVNVTRNTSGWAVGKGWRTFTFSSPVSVSSGTNTFTVTSYGGSRFGLYAGNLWQGIFQNWKSELGI